MAELLVGTQPIRLQDAQETAQSVGIQPERAHLATLGFDGRLPCGTASAAATVLLADASRRIASEGASELLRSLKPGGEVVLPPEIASDSLRSFLLKSGFRSARWCSDSTVRAYKPLYEQGAAVPLPAAALKRTSPGEVGEDDLINEDDLLDDEEVKPPADAATGCKPEKKKKACKNCTCGLADQTRVTVDADGSVADASGLPNSACGSCYLGDAFRCESCPYLGLPAFKPSQRGTAVVSETDDT
jgi:hypothetical protein